MAKENENAGGGTPPNRAVTSKMVRVRVGKQPVSEPHGQFRAPKEVFELPEDRAEALGKLVEPAPGAPLGVPKEEVPASVV